MYSAIATTAKAHMYSLQRRLLQITNTIMEVPACAELVQIFMAKPKYSNLFVHVPCALASHHWQAVFAKTVVHNCKDPKAIIFYFLFA